MKLLHSSTDKSAFIHRIQIPISYSALMFRVVGVSAGTAVFLRDVGRIFYRIRGRTMVSADFDMLHAIVNVAGGLPENSGMGSVGAYASSVIIPRNYYDDNVEQVNPDDTAEFETQFSSNLETFTASGFTAELYAFEEIGVSAYNLLIQQQELNIGGAVTIPDQVNVVENIAAIYLSDIVGGVLTLAASTINRVRYSIGNLFNGEFSTAAGLAKTNGKNRVEAAQSLLLEVFSAEVGDISSKLEDSAQLTFTTTAAARPQMLTFGLAFNPNKLADTAATTTQRLQNRLQAKDAGNQRRTASTVRAIVGAS